MIILFTEILAPYADELGIADAQGRLLQRGVEAVIETITDGNPYLIQFLPTQFLPMRTLGIECQQMVVKLKIEKRQEEEEGNRE